MPFRGGKSLYTAEHVVGFDTFLFAGHAQPSKLAHLDGMLYPLVGISRDQNLSRAGIGLEALRRVHLVADYSVVGPPFRTDISRDHNSRVDADSHVQAYLGKFYESDARQSFLNRQCTAHSTHRIIVARDGRAEKGH